MEGWRGKEVGWLDDLKEEWFVIKSYDYSTGYGRSLGGFGDADVPSLGEVGRMFEKS